MAADPVPPPTRYNALSLFGPIPAGQLFARLEPGFHRGGRFKPMSIAVGVHCPTGKDIKFDSVQLFDALELLYYRA